MITDILSHEDVVVVSLEDAMEHSRITDHYDETVVQMCLDAAHDIIEQYLNRRLSTTLMIGVVSDFRKRITLPYPPIQKITNITCQNANETSITLIEGVHYKFDNVRKAIIFLNSWNDAYMHTEFQVTFECGYAKIEDIPRSIPHAIRQTFATLYENREDTVIAMNVTEIPAPAKRLCKMHRVRPI